MKRALCVGVGLKSASLKEIKENLHELVDLVAAHDHEVVGTVVQLVPSWNPAWLIGSGKVQEIKAMIQDLGIQLVVIDHQLTGGQTRNLEQEWKVPVLDRSQIILEIFARRAKTFEGKLQVELAQMMDQLPRMVGAWMDSLSRQGGGVGTRGPGETALEQDKRRIRERMAVIRRKLEMVRQKREQNRQKRKKSDLVSFALVGYTNSGKSQLLNSLTGAQTLIQNQPFATLDPMTRRIYLGTEKEAVVTDTVGFIRKIPPGLIEAFKATLEESEESDVLLHVVDLANPLMDKHIAVVEGIVKDLGWDNKPMIYVFNKIDIAPLEARFAARGYPRVFISALTGEGLAELKSLMREFVEGKRLEREFFFSHADQAQYFAFLSQVEVISQHAGVDGYWVKARLAPDQQGHWVCYQIESNKIPS